MAVAADTRNRTAGRDERGLGDFQDRLNKGYHREPVAGPSRASGNGNGRDGVYRGHSRGNMGPPALSGPGQGKSWNDAPTPRTDRHARDGEAGGGTMRVPNRSWDETPARGGSSSAPRPGPGRSWDATPRTARGASPDPTDENGEMQLDVREWEEEQVRLDRDWYSTFDEGGVAGDDEHNPFAGFEEYGKAKEEEMQAKAVKKISARQHQYVGAQSREMTEPRTHCLVSAERRQ